MNELIIASKNRGKIEEYKNALKPLGFSLKSLLDFPEIEDVEEIGESFVENAIIKAKAIYNLTKKPIIADDSGLCVDALPEELGVRSKRFSSSGNDEDNIDLLLKKLSNISNRNASFVCVICFYSSFDSVKTYSGKTDGLIIDERRGKNGFGYDPIFYLPDLNKTFAQLNILEKQEVSHRGKAINKLIEDLNNENFNFQ